MSADDVWAVGGRYSTTAVTGLIQHWDGSRWRIVPSPRVGNDQVLEAVSAVSADDAWAVGTYDDDASTSIALVEHWDGSSWQVVDSLPTYRNLGLTGVTVLSASSMFAVGYAVGGRSGAIQQAVTLHLDGARHDLDLQPSPNGYVQEFTGVSMRTPTDGWAVGLSLPKFGKPRLSLAERWNGHRWRHVDPIQTGATSTSLGDVEVVQAGDVWAVGGASDKPAGPSYKLIERYTAGHWHVVKTPNLHATFSSLSAVSSSSHDDAWAVGIFTVAGVDSPLAMHWDGTSWKQVAMPPAGPNSNVVAVTDETNATWAVGVDYESDRDLRTIRDFWNGRRWVRR